MVGLVCLDAITAPSLCVFVQNWEMLLYLPLPSSLTLGKTKLKQIWKAT